MREVIFRSQPDSLFSILLMRDAEILVAVVRLARGLPPMVLRRYSTTRARIARSQSTQTCALQAQNSEENALGCRRVRSLRIEPRAILLLVLLQSLRVSADCCRASGADAGPARGKGFWQARVPGHQGPHHHRGCWSALASG